MLELRPAQMRRPEALELRLEGVRKVLQLMEEEPKGQRDCNRRSEHSEEQMALQEVRTQEQQGALALS